MVQIIHKTREQLTDERDALLATLDGCQDDTCPHHGDDLERLDTVLWLLGGCD